MIGPLEASIVSHILESLFFGKMLSVIFLTMLIYRDPFELLMTDTVSYWPINVVFPQIAISAMSVTSQLPGAALQANCALDDAPACCAIKRRISTDEAVSRLPTESTENFCSKYILN